MQEQFDPTPTPQQAERQTTDQPGSQAEERPIPDNAFDFVREVLEVNQINWKQQIFQAIGLAARSWMFWMIVSFLPIGHRRKNDVHRRLMSGQRVNWMREIIGPLSLRRLIVWGIVLCVLGYIILFAN
jgi:hypothetical protein